MTPPTDIVLGFHSRSPYNTVSYIQQCVESLKKTTSNYRLIFVDDFSDDEGRKVIQDIAAGFPSSVLIRTNKQRWFTRAFNLGLRMARTPRVVLLNSDCVLGDGWLDELYGVWDEVTAMGAKVGLVGSVFSAEEPRRWAQATHANGDYVTGHCWLVSMDALFDISNRRGQPGIYLDETKRECIHICSDRDGSWDMSKAGWVVVKSFKSAVGHVAGKSWGHDLARVFSLNLETVNDSYNNG